MNTHGPLNVAVFVEPSFGENSYLLWSRDAPDAWIVDPGFPPQPAQLAAALRRYELTPQAIVLTHGHVDHIAGIPALRERFPELPVIAPTGDAPLLTDATTNLSAPFGFAIVAPPADRLVAPGQTLKLATLTWQALDVSGHSPGGMAYYCAAAGVVLTGDALFAGSIGRTDFPGSSQARLLDNIRRSLLALPDATVVYSGHGPATTILDERETNPYLTGEPDA